ncbi:MAG: LytTR family transcriptional regulator [Hyphomonas sp.]|uniref:LytTR family DNA-binding domain-containing protein n=1 Tax=Hyphomonas sp. TaxID=87 RepID=UPI00180F24FE|nr:LytTR family DNA-binding domain-containing protein [Hyphomonas sp.]MBU3920534.1 LytTR family transcriptional regulator [Alphaproteobacteria bacterium]MBA3068514.1 LytTR family transcriptional regulator [Hyphomonas sp.]MBU4060618.1 LytTR family transcriptional regulator [Alphaproteobacteria bacterium]MBU4164602.1 LytTR family transcriptional regulator [Alphaproteobacteria bacterium]MBU4568900.1 LytTR family transcriptional regulator [Alphaproteobacteria bacterium]
MSIDWPRRLREFGVFGAAGLFLAFLNPYDSASGASFWMRAVYWVCLVMVGSYSAEAGRVLIDRFWPRGPLPVVMGLVSVAAALGVTAALMLIDYSFSARTIPLQHLPRLFGLVWVISIAMTAVGYMADKSILAPPPANAPDGAGPAETFLSRLPLKFRQADLYAVSSEDHYLRVHTNLGEELILMRLADAVRELDGAGGLQVHRSWWVSKAAVRDVKRAGGKLFLVLPSGKEAPVSRTYQPEAKAAGLL